MYPPAHVQTDDLTKLQAFIQQYYFGLLITHTSGLQYTPVPFVFNWQTIPATASCHLARNNPQLDTLHNAEVTIVIQGPDAFVPAHCYTQQPAVSTWNYALAELKGTAKILNTEQTLALVRQQEAHSAPDMLQHADYQQKLVQAIVGIEISLSSVTGRFKLSQNKPPAEQQAVIDYLQQTEQPRTVWRMMQQAGQS